MESYGYACIDGAAKFLPEILGGSYQRPSSLTCAAEEVTDFHLESIAGWSELSESEQSLIQEKLSPVVQDNGKRHGAAMEKEKGSKKKTRKH
eukprot:767340-Hanusia_phi.AAC.2